MNLHRVPSDKNQPLKYWRAVIELPTHDGKRRRKTVQGKDRLEVVKRAGDIETLVALSRDTPTNGG